MSRRDQKVTLNDGLRTAFMAVRKQQTMKCFSEVIIFYGVLWSYTDAALLPKYASLFLIWCRVFKNVYVQFLSFLIQDMQGSCLVFFFDDFCSWRLKSCPWWLWCPACIILLVSSLYHQIQGSSCRPVLGNPSVTQSCHVCILPKISFLLIFVKCDKPSYFKDLGEKQGLWFEMRFCYCAGIFYFYLELGQTLPGECVC